MLIAKLNGQKLTVVSDAVVSDSVKYLTVRFEYSREWDGFSKTAIFFGNDGSTYSVPMLEGNSMYIGENTCYVPYEVIKTPSFEISVFGTSGERVITSDKAMVGVRESGYCDGEIPAAPTPNEYSQIMEVANSAVDEALLAKQIVTESTQNFQNQLDSKMDKFGEVYDNDVVFQKNAYFEANINFFSGEARFVSQVEVLKSPEIDIHAVNKGYVDTLVENVQSEMLNFAKSPEKTFGDLGGGLLLENNKEYVSTKNVSYIEFAFPSGDFMCSLNFTTAAEGTINITFPEGTKFIGTKPTFGNGETWELNIKNGVVVGGKVV